MSITTSTNYKLRITKNESRNSKHKTQNSGTLKLCNTETLPTNNETQNSKRKTQNAEPWNTETLKH